MKKNYFAFAVLFLAMLSFKTYGQYDYSLEKPVIFENYFPTSSNRFELNETKVNYTGLITANIADKAELALRGMVDFGELSDQTGAITFTYSNTLVPSDSVSVTEPAGSLDVYIDDNSMPLVQVPVYKSKIRTAPGVVTETQFITTSTVTAMPTGKHTYYISWKGHASYLYNMKIESNGTKLDIVDTSLFTGNTGTTPASITVPLRKQPFHSDGNIVVHGYEMSLNPRSGFNFTPNTNSRTVGSSVDIGWIGSGGYCTVGDFDFGAVGTFKSVALKARNNKITANLTYELYLDTALVGGVIALVDRIAVIEFSLGWDVAPDGWVITDAYLEKELSGVQRVYVKSVDANADIRSIMLRRTEAIYNTGAITYAPLVVAINNATTVDTSYKDKAFVDGVTSGYSFPAAAHTTLQAAIATAQAMVDGQTATSQDDVTNAINTLNADVDIFKDTKIFTVLGDAFSIYTADMVKIASGSGLFENNGLNIGSTKANCVVYVGNVDFGTLNYQNTFVYTSRNGLVADNPVTGAYYQFILDDYNVATNVVSQPPIINTGAWSTYEITSDTLKKDLTGMHKLYIKLIYPNSVDWVTNFKIIGFMNPIITDVKEVAGTLKPKVYAANKTLFVRSIVGAKVEIFSVTGVKVLSKQITAPEVSNTLHSGVYIVRVSHAKTGVYTTKVVIE